MEIKKLKEVVNQEKFSKGIFIFDSMKHTNKVLLLKGLKFLAGALPLSFIGPVVLFSSFKNQENPWFLPVLIFALTAMAAAIYLMFKGIGTVIKALFD